jgi:2-oxoisovalerate dehydrogenase E2 component (dihydrolipoyl transacylase)
MQQLVMPNVGEGVQEGTVTRWLKREGEAVAADEPVVEVETDKAVVEIPSPYSGRLSRILVAEGETVPIGAPLAQFEASGAAAQSTDAPEEITPASSSTNRPARQEKPAAEALPAHAQAGAFARHSRNGAAERARRYSPVVLKLAAERDVDLGLVRGTGIEGRVTKQDVLRYIENPVLHAAPPPESAGVVGATKREPQAQPKPPAEPEPAPAPGAGEVVPLTPTRRSIARNLMESHRTIPAAWMAVEVDVTGLVELRAHKKEEFRRIEGVDLSYMPFFVEAIVGALKQFPEINTVFTEEGLRPQAGFHVGIAVATDWGLVVPVLRDAGDRSIAGLAKELERLGARARSRKLTLDEMRGAAVTIDNTGSFGSLISQPIVPPGQTAIVTTEVIRREVRPSEDGAIAVHSVMNLCVSFDHRAVDGDRVGRFMQQAKQNLESLRPDQPL